MDDIDRQVRALLLPAVGEPRLMRITPALQPIQQAVGGYIEGVPIAEGAVLYCNEEGKLQGLPVNEAGNRLADVTIPWFRQQGDFLVGDCLVFGTLDEDGALDEVEHDVPEAVLQACRQAGLTVVDEA
jgi:hypothetical protein